MECINRDFCAQRIGNLNGHGVNAWIAIGVFHIRRSPLGDCLLSVAEAPLVCEIGFCAEDHTRTEPDGILQWVERTVL